MYLYDKGTTMNDLGVEKSRKKKRERKRLPRKTKSHPIFSPPPLIINEPLHAGGLGSRLPSKFCPDLPAP